MESFSIRIHDPEVFNVCNVFSAFCKRMAGPVQGLLFLKFCQQILNCTHCVYMSCQQDAVSSLCHTCLSRSVRIKKNVFIHPCHFHLIS